MRHMDLFSGIGGMSLALRGISVPILYCDKCPDAQRVLQLRMHEGQLPQAPIYDDVRKLKPHRVDLITAGFPCTGFTNVGLMAGFAHPESALFYSLVKVCASSLPSLVFMENTPSIAHQENLKMVTSHFKRIGYKLRSCIIPVYAVGIPQIRNRWFAIAWRHDEFLQALTARMHKVRTWAKQTAPSTTVKQESNDPLIRFRLLKNAVVPAAATLALRVLLTSRDVLYVPVIPKPDLHLVLRQGRRTFKKAMWPTLFGNYCRTPAKVLTERASTNISSAIFYEERSKLGFVNLSFLEWLMGFPLGWTELQSVGK